MPVRVSGPCAGAPGRQRARLATRDGARRRPCGGSSSWTGRRPGASPSCCPTRLLPAPADWPELERPRRPRSSACSAGASAGRPRRLTTQAAAAPGVAGARRPQPLPRPRRQPRSRLGSRLPCSRLCRLSRRPSCPPRSRYRCCPCSRVTRGVARPERVGAHRSVVAAAPSVDRHGDHDAEDDEHGQPEDGERGRFRSPSRSRWRSRSVGLARRGYRRHGLGDGLGTRSRCHEGASPLDLRILVTLRVGGSGCPTPVERTPRRHEPGVVTLRRTHRPLAPEFTS